MLGMSLIKLTLLLYKHLSSLNGVLNCTALHNVRQCGVAESSYSSCCSALPTLPVWAGAAPPHHNAAPLSPVDNLLGKHETKLGPAATRHWAPNSRQHTAGSRQQTAESRQQTLEI